MDNAIPPLPEPVTAEQLRAARSLLRLAQRDLAARAGVPLPALRRLEGVGGTAKVPPEIVRRTRAALEQAGAVFVAGGVQPQATKTKESSDTDRAARVAARLERISQLPVLDDRSPWQMLDDMYDADGLPR